MEVKNTKVVIQTSGAINRVDNLTLTAKEQKKLETYTNKLVNCVPKVKKDIVKMKNICSNCGSSEKPVKVPL